MLLGSARVKAAHKIMVKLTKGQEEKQSSPRKKSFSLNSQVELNYNDYYETHKKGQNDKL